MRSLGPNENCHIRRWGEIWLGHVSWRDVIHWRVFHSWHRGTHLSSQEGHHGKRSSISRPALATCWDHKVTVASSFFLLLTIMPAILRTTPVLPTTWGGEHLVLRTGIGGFLWKFLESNWEGYVSNPMAKWCIPWFYCYCNHNCFWHFGIASWNSVNLGNWCLHPWDVELGEPGCQRSHRITKFFLLLRWAASQYF